MGFISRIREALNSQKSESPQGVKASPLQSKTNSVGNRVFHSISSGIDRLKEKFGFHTSPVPQSAQSEKNIDQLRKNILDSPPNKKDHSEKNSYADKLARNIRKYFNKSDKAKSSAAEQPADVKTAAPKPVKIPDPQNMAELETQITDRLKELTTPKQAFNPHLKRMMPAHVTPKEKEEIRLLKSLQLKMEEAPGEVEKTWEKAQNDPAEAPLYKQMGAVRFLSIYAKINESKAQGRKSSEGLSLAHEMSLMGYTTDDYQLINPAMRKVQGEADSIPEKDTAVYAKTLEKAVDLLPNMPVPEGGLELKRAMNIPEGAGEEWVKNLFQEGSFFADNSFTSTSYSSPIGAQIILTYRPPKGATEFEGVKLIEEAYSVWPEEKEALIQKNTPFRVESYKKEGGVIYVDLRGLPAQESPNRKQWRYAGSWFDNQ